MSLSTMGQRRQGSPSHRFSLVIVTPIMETDGQLAFSPASRPSPARKGGGEVSRNGSRYGQEGTHHNLTGMQSGYPTTFGVFDTFNDEDGRQRHLDGPIGQALMAKAPELFSSPPSIEPVVVLGIEVRPRPGLEGGCVSGRPCSAEPGVNRHKRTMVAWLHSRSVHASLTRPDRCALVSVDPPRERAHSPFLHETDNRCTKRIGVPCPAFRQCRWHWTRESRWDQFRHFSSARPREGGDPALCIPPGFPLSPGNERN